MNLLSTGLLIALIVISATAFVLSLNEDGVQLSTAVYVSAHEPYWRQTASPAPCPKPPAADEAPIDPGILAPAPQAPVDSQMPTGGRTVCYSSMPMTR